MWECGFPLPIIIKLLWNSQINQYKVSSRLLQLGESHCSYLTLPSLFALPYSGKSWFALSFDTLVLPLRFKKLVSFKNSSFDRYTNLNYACTIHFSLLLNHECVCVFKIVYGFSNRSSLTNYRVLKRTGAFHKTEAIQSAVSTITDPHSIVLLFDLHLLTPSTFFSVVRKVRKWLNGRHAGKILKGLKQDKNRWYLF